MPLPPSPPLAPPPLSLVYWWIAHGGVDFNLVAMQRTASIFICCCYDCYRYERGGRSWCSRCRHNASGQVMYLKMRLQKKRALLLLLIFIHFITQMSMQQRSTNHPSPSDCCCCSSHRLLPSCKNPDATIVTSSFTSVNFLLWNLPE